MAPDCTFSQEHIELLGIISEGRMFRIHKARRGTKYIILKSAVHKDAMTTEFLRREYELGNTLSHSSIVTTLGFEEDTPAGDAEQVADKQEVFFPAYDPEKSPQENARIRKEYMEKCKNA